MTSRHYPHRLQFLEPTKTTDTKSGQVVRTFAAAFDRRGLVQVSGSENKTAANGQQVALNTYTIELRHDAALEDIRAITWQITWLDSDETLVVKNVTHDRSGRQPVTRITAITAL